MMDTIMGDLVVVLALIALVVAMWDIWHDGGEL
jgi:hypothetical protein